MILRYSLTNLEQYIIDPEREYTNICEKLKGTLIKIGPNSDVFINVFDIREESMEEAKGYLASKITKLIGFFKLIFGEINEEEKALLEEKIAIKPVFKESKDMPTLGDLYEILRTR